VGYLGDTDMTDDLDAALAGTEPAPETARSVVRSDRKCRRHQWAIVGTASPVVACDSIQCIRCGVTKDPVLSRRGKTSRDYGNRAELKVARTYGGTKVGHHGGPVDVRGKDWHTQVKTHRRLPPAEWRAVFAALEASTDRLPRLLLRFVHDGGPTDYIVVPGKAWLDWFGKDEETE
jgi:hypothetical protein